MSTAVAQYTGGGEMSPLEIKSKVAQNLYSEEARAVITPLLPHGVSYDVVISEVHRAAVRNPEIVDCTPASLIMAVADGVQQGLKFGETIHIVRFNTNVGTKENKRWEARAQAIRDYKGDIELVLRSGAARAVDAQPVYENEPFEIEQGTRPSIIHKPMKDEKSRGKLIGFYAIAWLSAYLVKIVYMTVAEIDKIRHEKSKSWKEGPLEVWYGKKTVIHQVTKALPKNPKLADVLTRFEKEEQGEIEPVEYAALPSSPSEVRSGPAAGRPLSPHGEQFVGSNIPIRHYDDNDDSKYQQGLPVAVTQEVRPSAASASTDDPELAKERDKARTTKLMGKPDSWGANGGKQLQLVPTPALKQARSFFGRLIKGEVEGSENPSDKQKASLEAQIEAITTVLEEREELAGQGSLDLASPKGAKSKASKNAQLEPHAQMADRMREPGEEDESDMFGYTPDTPAGRNALEAGL